MKKDKVIGKGQIQDQGTKILKNHINIFPSKLFCPAMKPHFPICLQKYDAIL